MIRKDDKGNVTAITCSRPKRCSYCDRPSTKLCDHPQLHGRTCDTPMCATHTWSPEPEKDYCRIHRRQIEGPKREEQRKAELSANKRDSLIFIADSKYAGVCKEKDCGARWKAGDSIYWDQKTREAFCEECGELMSPF